MEIKTPRIVHLEELEAWLQELPHWEAAIDEYVSLGPTAATLNLGSGGKSGGPKTSRVEKEVVNRLVLEERVRFLRDEISRLPEYAQRFIAYHYLHRGPRMTGHTRRETQKLFGLTIDEYYGLREKSLLPIIVALYVWNLDLGRPYSFCARSRAVRKDGLYGPKPEEG